MRILSPNADRDEAYALPPSLSTDSIVGLKDSEIAQIKGKSLASKIQADSRKAVRKATSQVGALNFFQQISVTWPNTTAILVRAAMFTNPCVPDWKGEYKTLLARLLAEIAARLNTRLLPGAVVTGNILSNVSVFDAYCRTVIEVMTDLANWHIIKNDPPGAKPATGEGVEVFMWQWWKCDIATWLPKSPFGATAHRSPEPLLPAEHVTPLIRFSEKVAPSADRLAKQWGLTKWQREHLMPRLFDANDILVLDPKQPSASNSSVSQFL